jgi:hypothetical protein
VRSLLLQGLGKRGGARACAWGSISISFPVIVDRIPFFLLLFLKRNNDATVTLTILAQRLQGHHRAFIIAFVLVLHFADLGWRVSILAREDDGLSIRVGPVGGGVLIVAIVERQTRARLGFTVASKGGFRRAEGGFRDA